MISAISKLARQMVAYRATCSVIHFYCVMDVIKFSVSDWNQKGSAHEKVPSKSLYSFPVKGNVYEPVQPGNNAVIIQQLKRGFKLVARWLSFCGLQGTVFLKFW